MEGTHVEDFRTGLGGSLDAGTDSATDVEETDDDENNDGENLDQTEPVLGFTIGLDGGQIERGKDDNEDKGPNPARTTLC